MMRMQDLPEDIFSNAMSASSNALVVCDANNSELPLVYVNPAFEKITGYSPQEVIGRNMRFLQGPETGADEIETIRRSIETPAEVRVTLKNYRKDGSFFWNQLFICPAHNSSGELTHFIGVIRDASKEEELSRKLADYDNYDSLTGLPNRKFLQERLIQCVEQPRYPNRELAVVYLDLDGFKPINDHFGHSFGDSLLQAMATRLLGLVRAGDTLARIESDEFVILLPDLASATSVVAILERILQEIAVPVIMRGVEVQLSASIGVTLSEKALPDPMVLIQQADLAMHQAKKRGRNNFQWYSSDLNASVTDFLNIRNHMQKAIEGNEFTLHYQPKFDLRSQRCSGIEALARWHHPIMGEISPSRFIPVAEQTGFIISFSEWALRQACKDFKILQKADPELPSVSVNISVLHFLRDNFVDSIREILREAEFEPACLDLEITESVLLSDPEDSIKKMRALKKLGLSLSLDDFGTGFSSFSYLKKLPIDTLKIDRSFIADLTHEKGDAAIVQGIISMSHHLGLRVVAEGVESKAQLNFLQRALCDEIQGFLKARPMPLQAIESFMSQYRQQVEVEKEADIMLPVVLLVDDEPNVLRSLQRLLRRDGYQILTAENAEQAFELLTEHDVNVIVSDQRMRHMNGTELLNHVKSMYPSIVRIVLSGYMDLKSVTAAINQGQIYKFLTKPWDDKELRQVVRDAVHLNHK
ncbi:GGDEF domain-containing protein [Aliidiomarina minuta]|uniref:cyclic-guanylate-specific phosphodiesterase n=1 Tax=Aliidiomarina minuta TaxID=880057 RepID=A0A432W4Q3_9GAMM|nr:EAL domain-containing protein [Aliidiomarina minuta]RUO24481.1 GGDEF domain-containing protein [Aliidiomarina minuta]